MNRFTSTSALPLCLLLAACGGGGDGTFIASIPPPPAPPAPAATPTPTRGPAADAFPTTRIGTYDLLGIVRGTSGATASGEFTMTVSRPSADQGLAYRLTGPTGFLPIAMTSIDFGSTGTWEIQPNGDIVGGYSQTLPFSADKNIRSSLSLDAGYSYVSMGEWLWYLVHLDGGTAGPSGDLFFVNGDHTPQSGIPLSGTATYDAHTFALLSSNLTPGIPFTLTADFRQRTISTQIDQDYRYNSHGDLLDSPAPGIHVSGSAPFTSGGSFDLPLTGTANGGGYNLPTPPSVEPVSGSVAGAFFGPHAEQIGGTFFLQNAAGVQVLRDAFVGQQHH